MYWSDAGTLAKIERASMNGASKTTLHSSNLAAPYALTIDYESQTLYWADYTLDKLESSNTDGSNRLLLTTNSIQSPYAMAFYDRQLYWTDWSLNGIYSTFLTSPSSVTTVYNSGSDPYGIRIIAEETQPEGEWNCNVSCCIGLYHLSNIVILDIAPNPCAVSNGGCSHLCLLSAVNSSGYSCSCPEDLLLIDNQRDCIRKWYRLKVFFALFIDIFPYSTSKDCSNTLFNTHLSP